MVQNQLLGSYFRLERIINMASIKEQLLTAIDQYQGDLLKQLDRIVAFNTVSPPARNTAKLQQFIHDELEEYGFDAKQQDFYDGDQLLSATKSGTHSDNHHSLILNGHVDVAALENRDEWQTDPFKLVKRGDTLIGRGVSDMKGAVAAYLFIFQLLKKLNIELPGDLKFQSVVGEELGEAGTKTLLKQGEKADFAIVGDTSGTHFQGQGGVITGWITLKSPHTYHDGNRISMVQTGGGLKAASMVEKMVVVISALQTLERYWGITKSYPGFKPGTDTINPAYIKGGIHPAFVADECRLWITVHFYPNETVEGIEKEVEDEVIAAAKADPWLRDNLPTFNWGGDSMLVDKGEVFPSLELDKNSAAMKLLNTSYQSSFGQKPVIGMSTSVSDGGWFGYYHIPAVIYGPGELVQAHSDNESASFDQLLNYTKSIAGFVVDWCQSEK
ncbi:acetylornithine deacetylase [Lentilactobacillus hilgardii]|uniref:acetylornithine deacetylase n=1 Tax=Lentilactobacillus hilgardii TaxID=1588 RepID=UPI0021A8702A|nr:acetylornithine deacetylase [Lentilactobacillus hilgardii]MCT3398516.1 acetylornithine deacetylase [Lentilactobacillus hilgardii]